MVVSSRGYSQETLGCPDEGDALWEAYAKVYVIMQRVPFVVELRQRHARAMEGLDHILDAGCGPGLISEELSKDKRKMLVSADSSRGMLEVARKRLKGAKNINLHQADVGKLPYRDQSFDGYVSNNVLYYLSDPRKVISEAVRVTRPGGIISIASARPGINIEVLVNGFMGWLEQSHYAVSEKELAVFFDINRKLGEQGMRNVYEPPEISGLLLESGFREILCQETAYLGQDFYVAARR